MKNYIILNRLFPSDGYGCELQTQLFFENKSQIKKYLSGACPNIVITDNEISNEDFCTIRDKKMQELQQNYISPIRIFFDGKESCILEEWRLIYKKYELTSRYTARYDNKKKIMKNYLLMYSYVELECSMSPVVAILATCKTLKEAKILLKQKIDEEHIYDGEYNEKRTSYYYGDGYEIHLWIEEIEVKFK